VRERVRKALEHQLTGIRAQIDGMLQMIAEPEDDKQEPETAERRPRFMGDTKPEESER
jgi:hypothetical protein